MTTQQCFPRSSLHPHKTQYLVVAALATHSSCTSLVDRWDPPAQLVVLEDNVFRLVAC